MFVFKNSLLLKICKIFKTFAKKSADFVKKMIVFSHKVKYSKILPALLCCRYANQNPIRPPRAERS